MINNILLAYSDSYKSYFVRKKIIGQIKKRLKAESPILKQYIKDNIKEAQEQLHAEIDIKIYFKGIK